MIKNYIGSLLLVMVCLFWVAVPISAVIGAIAVMVGLFAPNTPIGFTFVGLAWLFMAPAFKVLGDAILDYKDGLVGPG